MTDPILERLRAIDRRSFRYTIINAALLLALLSLAAWLAGSH